eukprot:gene12278-biopygen8139
MTRPTQRQVGAAAVGVEAADVAPSEAEAGSQEGSLVLRPPVPAAGAVGLGSARGELRPLIFLDVAGSGPVPVRFRSGSGPVQVRFRSGSGPVQVRFRSGSGPVRGPSGARPGPVRGPSRARSGTPVWIF